MSGIGRFVADSMAAAAEDSQAFESVKITGRDGSYYTAEYRGQTMSIPRGTTDLPDGWALVARRAGGGFQPLDIDPGDGGG